MKQLNKQFKYLTCVLILLGLSVSTDLSAQDSATAEPAISLRYFVNNNSVQYLLVQTVMKEGKKSQPLPRRSVKLFLDSSIAENLLAKTLTDENGKAKVIIPPAFRDKWTSNSKHKFIGVMDAASTGEEKTAELEITRAKLTIDTSYNEGVRSVNVKIMVFENNDWVPAPDVEMKVGVNRLGGILSAGDKETYTTDSTGTIDVEFMRQGLPGDQKGNYVLVANVEDNEQYGNLLVEKTVPWGVAVIPDTHFFDQRTLWSTRFRSPFWLLFMVYAIVISVWGTIAYLVLQIVKINKLGKDVKPGHALSS